MPLCSDPVVGIWAHVEIMSTEGLASGVTQIPGTGVAPAF